MAQQRKLGPTEAEIGAKPIGDSQPSEPSQPAGTRGSKRVRLPFKSSPSQTKSSKGQGRHKSSSQEATSQEDPRTLTEKAFDPDFTPSKVLSSNASLTASAQAISKWIAKLRLNDELKAQLQQSCKVAAATLKSCTEEEIHIRHLDWTIRNLDVAMIFEQSSALFFCFVELV